LKGRMERQATVYNLNFQGLALASR
jgi:hypothetical protein